LPPTTQFLADNLAHHNHGATSSLSYSPTITAPCGFPLAQARVQANLQPAVQGASWLFIEDNTARG
jgi:hypothetical protein